MRWDLYPLGQALTDLQDALQRWRFRHLSTASRIIAMKSGIGGTRGVEYLQRMPYRVVP